MSSAYTTPAAIYAEIPQPSVNDACDDLSDGNAAEIAAVLTQIIANASNAIDGYLAARYTTPFSAPYPVQVTDAALIFACEKIWARRPIADRKNPFTARADEYRQIFKDIAERKRALDIKNAGESPGAQVGGYKPVAGRMSTLPTFGDGNSLGQNCNN